MFMLIFNQKSTWNSKVWLHSELDFIFSDFGTVVFTTLSMLEASDFAWDNIKTLLQGLVCHGFTPFCL